MCEWQNYSTLHERLRCQLEKMGWSATNLAAASGISKTLAYQLVSGERGAAISAPTMFRLQRALQVPYSFFDLEASHKRNQEGEPAEAARA